MNEMQTKKKKKWNKKTKVILQRNGAYQAEEEEEEEKTRCMIIQFKWATNAMGISTSKGIFYQID